MDPISVEKLDCLIEAAGKAAGYENGFGLKGCDLTKPIWWAAYIRQSLEEQAQNNRVPEYMLTCARMAKGRSVVVPREYILVDHESSEYLDRRQMASLRKELIAKRRIKGILIPLQGRLIADAGQQSIFEKECNYYAIEYVFGDAPSGSDWASITSRLIMAQAQALRLKTNRDNARAGNIGRVLKGMVPANRAAFGYRYRREADIGSDGRIHVRRAWWEKDEIGPDGQCIEGSPASTVTLIFGWVGNEGRSLRWVADTLNEERIKAPEGGSWSPSKVSNIIHHKCYTGHHLYNYNAKVPNPERPLVDPTAAIKRTLKRPKPSEEWIEFSVPSLVSEELWQKTQASVTVRGRGRGKQGRTIKALLRNRLFCPKCGQPMVIRRKSCEDRTYYHCSKYHRPWVNNPCNFRKFIPGTWDGLVWDDIRVMLRNDVWVEHQLSSAQCQDENSATLIRLNQLKISQTQAQILRVHEGYEREIYTSDEAKRRLDNHRAVVHKAEAEIQRLQEGMKAPANRVADIELIRQELHAIRDRNLDQATFEEKAEIISKLGIKVYPAEDLKSIRVLCQLNLELRQLERQKLRIDSFENQADRESESATGCGIVKFGSPNGSIHRTFRATFEMPVIQSNHNLIKVGKRRYRNPIYLAQEWRKALEHGEHTSPAALARALKVSRARVTQIMNLLDLSPEAIKLISSLGDPLRKPVITERSLRQLSEMAPEKQVEQLKTILMLTLPRC